MTRKRTIATLAALGGLTAAVALLSGQPVAKADELTDLRANQQLLQQRLDQLAQSQNVGGGPVLAPGGGGPATVQMMGGSFPRSFLIPGTDTSIRVGGNIYVDTVFYINGGNPGSVHQNNAGATGQLNTIPLSNQGAARARSDNILIITPRRTNLNFETRTPTAWGEARTFVEFDFAANANLAGRPLAISDNINLRLRYAYGTLGGFLAGQANSNFTDPDANVETLDFGGLVGGPGHSRIPQIRYTMPLTPWGLLGAFSVAAEQPESEVWSPGTGVCGTFNTPPAAPCNGPTGLLKSPAPDITAAWYIPQPWGHVDFSAVVRPTLQIEDGTGAVDKMYTGYGVHFSGDVKPGWLGWDRDYIAWNFTYGDAIGPYLNPGSGNGTLGLVSNFGAAGVTPANALFKPVTGWGGTVGYQHRWLPNLRSNVGFGIYHEDINGMRGVVCPFIAGTSAAAITARTARQAGTAGCGLNKELAMAVANLIWEPVPFVDFGVEYLWGHRLTTGNQRGDENVINSRMRIRF